MLDVHQPHTSQLASNRALRLSLLDCIALATLLNNPVESNKYKARLEQVNRAIFKEVHLQKIIFS